LTTAARRSEQIPVAKLLDHRFVVSSRKIQTSYAAVLVLFIVLIVPFGIND